MPPRPSTPDDLAASAAARLQANTDTSGGPDACWPWLGAAPKGQPVLWADGAWARARALWWARTHGTPPARGGALRATCRNAGCVNPSHLRYTPPPDGPPRRNPGDADPDGPTTPHQRARLAALGVPCPPTVGEAAAAIVKADLTRWGLWWPGDAARM